MIRNLLLPLALLAAMASPVHAGVNLMCEGEGVEADFPMGGGTGFSLLSASVWLGDKESRREGDKGLVEAVQFRHAWVDDQVFIDLADPNYERVVVRIRLFSAPAYDVLAGLIEVVDVGAYPVTCGVG